MDDTLKTNIPDRASPSEESTIRLFPILGGSRRLDISSEIIHRAFMLMLKRFEDAKDAYDAPNPLMDEPHVLLLLPPPPSFSFLLLPSPSSISYNNKHHQTSTTINIPSDFQLLPRNPKWSAKLSQNLPNKRIFLQFRNYSPTNPKRILKASSKNQFKNPSLRIP